MNINFLVKANRQTGLGHIIRSLALADEFKARGHSCCFFTNVEAAKRIEAAGHSYCLTVNPPAELSKAPIWVVDLPLGIPLSIAQALRDKCAVLAVLNGAGHPDGDPGRLLADLVFYQGCTLNPYALSWDGFEGEWFEGAHWLILRDEFKASERRNAAPVHSHVTITGGGSDPKDITSKAIAALLGKGLELRVIIGPSYQGNWPNFSDYVELVFNPPSMADELSWADAAIISYGMTTFECLALGIPTIALSISPDHVASAQLVQERSGGALHSLGEVEQVTAEDICSAVKDALDHREELSQKARAFIDGRGAERVADKILETAIFPQD